MEDDEDKEEPMPLAAPKPAVVPVAQSAIDLTAEFLRPLLTSENVANLVSDARSEVFFYLKTVSLSLFLVVHCRFLLAWSTCLMPCRRPSRPHTHLWSRQELMPR